MFGNKKIKSISDYQREVEDFTTRAGTFFSKGDNALTNQSEYIGYLCIANMTNQISDNAFKDLIKKHCEPRQANDYIFFRGLISYEEFEKERLRITLEESIAKIDSVDSFVDMYTQTEDAIRKNYERKLNELNFKLGNVDFITHEIENATLLGQPYAKVFFTPSKEEESKLEVDIRFNRIFIERLAERDGFKQLKDDEGNIIEESLIEEWFQTAIIVLAANMLKESDLDFFRSIASDDAGHDLIQRLEFDKENIPDEYKDRAEEILQHRGIYK